MNVLEAGVQQQSPMICCMCFNTLLATHPWVQTGGTERGATSWFKSAANAERECSPLQFCAAKVTEKVSTAGDCLCANDAVLLSVVG